MSAIGIFGGTFDPIHYGHLRTAFELLHELRLSEVRFIPSGDPPHRKGTFADAETRLKMVTAAVSSEPGFVVDDRELQRAGPSFTIDTLDAIRAEFSSVSLSLILGMDAFADLTSWHRWDELLDYAHIVVAHRPGWQPPDSGALGELLDKRAAKSVDDIHAELSGRIYIHAVTQLEISSTEIRALVKTGGDPRFLMPDVVRDTISADGCYA
jgi:nicotinate-nucleotide adenylyltransferase